MADSYGVPEKMCLFLFSQTPICVTEWSEPFWLCTGFECDNIATERFAQVNLVIKAFASEMSYTFQLLPYQRYMIIGLLCSLLFNKHPLKGLTGTGIPLSEVDA